MSIQVNIIINEKQLQEELEHQPLPHSTPPLITSLHQRITFIIDS